MKPYCFVLMPFGSKTDESGQVVEFDQVYNDIIHPAIVNADLKPIRADEEIIGGIIHKPMFERLMLCDYAIADLTTANANVFYELGIRHGLRPHSTVLTFASGMRLPFDVNPLRGIPYELNENGEPVNAAKHCEAIANRLRECREPIDDSPVYQLISDIRRPEIDRLKTDVFRDVVEYSREKKEELRQARKIGSDEIKKVEQTIDLIDGDPAVIIDLFLSYRAVENWQSMVDLTKNMTSLVADSILVQEQLGFALNRLELHDEAEKVLTDVISKHGASSETNGILGRVYKDIWQKNLEAGNDTLANAYLKKAIDTYLLGFEADWRDAYPGVNAVTLMEMSDPIDERQKDIIPVVRYSVKRRLATKHPDYWDYATLLELEVLSSNKKEAMDLLEKAITEVREKWEPKSTVRNLRLIRQSREKRGEPVDWIVDIEEELLQVAEQI